MSDTESPMKVRNPKVPMPPPPRTMKSHEACITDRPAPIGQDPKGEIIQLDDIDTYVSKPADYPQSPAKLLLLLTSGTGISSVNNRLQADLFASEGFLVVMPDLFEGDPAPKSEPTAKLETLSAIAAFRYHTIEVGKCFLIDMWLARHTERHTMPVLYRVLAACADEYADAVTAGGGVYAVGYCVGGRYVFLLGSEEQDPAWGGKAPDDDPTGPQAGSAMKGGPLIKAGAVAHPTSVMGG